MRAKWFVVWVGLCTIPLVAWAQEVAVEKDIVYGRSGDVDLKLDLAKPPGAKGPSPGLVCIHGGAWETGNKEAYDPFIRQFAAHGYVTAAVEYRLAPKYPWPAQIEDVKCAVRYLRARAKDLNIDPEKIGAIGDSAGGHLSLLLGLMDPKDGLEGNGGNPGLSSKVQVVVNLFGPTDMRTWRLLPEAEAPFAVTLGKSWAQMITEFLGTSDRNAPVMVQASPITYVNRGDPPILTFHGTKDPIVPIKQAKQLHEALQKAGVQQKLVVMEGAGHGWEGEQLAKTVQEGMQFLDAVFNGATKPSETPPQPTQK